MFVNVVSKTNTKMQHTLKYSRLLLQLNIPRLAINNNKKYTNKMQNDKYCCAYC